MSRRYLIAALPLALALAMGGCNDKDETPLPDLSTTTYTGSELTLLYNGVESPEKSVTVTPSDNGKATLELFSTVDLSQLQGLGLTGTIPGPGVIPGETQTSLEVDLTPGNGCYTFSGESSTADVTFSYAGELRDRDLSLSIISPQLKDKSLAGPVWSPAPLERGEGLEIKSSPLSIVWDVDIPGLTLSPGTALNLLATLPCIPVYQGTAYTSPAELLTQVIKTLTFRADGNVIVTYLSTSQGAAQYMTLQANSMQYVPDGAGALKLYLNPVSLYSLYLVNQKPGSGFNDISMLKTLISTFVPALAQGLTLDYAAETSGQTKIMRLYTPTEESVQMLSAFLEKLMSDPEVMEKVTAAIDSSELLKPYADDLKKVATQLPQLLSATSRLELGFCLTPHPLSP